LLPEVGALLPLLLVEPPLASLPELDVVAASASGPTRLV
jgi:hypothetical protein